MLEFESILDAPREGLDPTVWKDAGDGKFVLTDEARSKVQTLVDWVGGTFGLKDMSVRITGSITSNQYSDDSDIDVHISFDGLTDDNSDEMNKALRAEFEENFKDLHTDSIRIGSHPLEVYFQANPFQDLMSVGCYDFNQKLWLVGPDLKPLDFDPYSEFYSEDMKYAKEVVEDVRDTVLRCYETAMVILNSSSWEFKAEEFGHLKETIARVSEIFDAAKQSRKVYSTPNSVEDALQKRSSRKWKIADSAFKLMDKFGYLRVLKGISKLNGSMDNHDADSAAESVVSIVGGLVGQRQTVDESVSDWAKFLALASFLSIPGLLPKDALAAGLEKVDPKQLQA